MLPSVAAINHLLRAAPWAVEKLRRHAGKVARIDVGLATLRYAVTDSGEVTTSDSQASEAVHMHLSPGLMLRVAGGNREALSEAQITGDAEFAADLAYVAKYLSWDVEEDLSKVVGDIAAHRIVGTARSLRDWGRQSQENFLQSLKEHWTEERPVFPHRREVESFVRDVNQVKDEVERLAMRIKRLQDNLFR